MNYFPIMVSLLKNKVDSNWLLGNIPSFSVIAFKNENPKFVKKKKRNIKLFFVSTGEPVEENFLSLPNLFSSYF